MKKIKKPVIKCIKCGFVFADDYSLAEISCPKCGYTYTRKYI